MFTKSFYLLVFFSLYSITLSQSNNCVELAKIVTYDWQNTTSTEHFSSQTLNWIMHDESKTYREANSKIKNIGANIPTKWGDVNFNFATDREKDSEETWSRFKTSYSSKNVAQSSQFHQEFMKVNPKSLDFLKEICGPSTGLIVSTQNIGPKLIQLNILFKPIIIGHTLNVKNITHSENVKSDITYPIPLGLSVASFIFEREDHNQVWFTITSDNILHYPSKTAIADRLEFTNDNRAIKLGKATTFSINKINTAESDQRIFVNMSIDAANKGGLLKILFIPNQSAEKVIADDELKWNYNKSFTKIFDLEQGDSWIVNFESHQGNTLLPDFDLSYRKTYYEDDPYPHGLIINYPFDGNSIDNSGNFKHCTFVGNYSTSIDRKNIKNKAIQLMNNSHIKIPENNLLPKGDRPRTISFWFKTLKNNGGQRIFQYGQDVDHRLFSVHIENENIGIQTYNDDHVKVPVTANLWHHVCAVYGGGNQIEFYLDGQINNFQLSDILSTESHKKSAYPPYIGAGGKKGDKDQFIGSIDDFLVFNRALSKTEVVQLYNK